MLTQRQQEILKRIIENYIDSACPVASGFIAENIAEKVSSATIRNEFTELEKAGFIRQPHTSAGRIPTQKAYEMFVQCSGGACPADLGIVAVDAIKRIKNILKQNENERAKIKEIAKIIAERSNEAVVVAFDRDDNYYTGLSNIFAQPEFQEQEVVVNLSEIVDQLDRVMDGLFDSTRLDISVLIGKNNPFGPNCSAIIADYRRGTARGIIAIVGPMRMDYVKNISLMREIINLLK